MLLTASILVSPTTTWSQMPPPPGRLVISSNPGGAIVTINGERMTQPTNATFVVSPGTYTVTVTSATSNLNCPGISLNVSGGQTVSRTCSARGWEQ